MRRIASLSIAFLLASIGLQPVSFAGSIRLRWDPVPGASAYRVYYGTASGNYSGTMVVTGQAEGVLAGLQDCTTYYVAVKAFNGVGESEDYSNEISGWSKPEIQNVTPDSLMQGRQYAVTVEGSNFTDAAQVLFDAVDIDGRPLMRVDSLEVLSCGEIHALVTIEPMARGFRAMETGSEAFLVANPDGVVGSGQLEVLLNPERLDINRSDAQTLNRVDGRDLVWLAWSHGSHEGEDRFRPDADLNGDGLVDGEDLSHLASVFGSCWDGSGTWSIDACQ